MAGPDEAAARTTLRIAGVFQEIRDSWVRRLDSYFNQIESLTEGDWIDSEDLIGIIRESRMASREAMDGLGNDLSSELVHSSHGIVTRYEAERQSLQEEIDDLRKSLARALSGDANTIRRENEALTAAINLIPEYNLLEFIQKKRQSTYDELAAESGISKGQVRKLVKLLVSRGYVQVDKKSRPHLVIHMFTPWSVSEDEVQCTLEVSTPNSSFQTRFL
ncbi:winged helix-turn-helix transcriptional regulator [Candidatus Thorarchaeota archaeon]|nr:MAG: winged helix-turn-helix transcriptional regulator [Candidatus Thorarchaeota archaeon]